jgi:hypothetical protein
VFDDKMKLKFHETKVSKIKACRHLSSEAEASRGGCESILGN